MATIMMNDVQRTNLAKRTIDGIEDYMCDLFSRWLDEREYEDIEEYELAMRNHDRLKNPKVVVITMMGEPFTLLFSIDETTYMVWITEDEEDEMFPDEVAITYRYKQL